MKAAALVIGASRGIGFGIARALADEGCNLTLVARDPNELAAAAEDLGGSARAMETVPADLADADSISAALEHHRAAFGRLDVLAIVGARTLAATVERSPAEAVADLFAVNVVGTAEAVRLALPDLRASASAMRPARVLLLGSLAGRVPVPGFAAYSASKAAVRSLALSICQEEGPNGVLATAIAPGFVATDMTARLAEPMAEEMLTVDDVAEAARFVFRLSARASVPELLLCRVGAPVGAS